MGPLSLGSQLDANTTVLAADPIEVPLERLPERYAPCRANSHRRCSLSGEIRLRARLKPWEHSSSCFLFVVIPKTFSFAIPSLIVIRGQSSPPGCLVYSNGTHPAYTGHFSGVPSGCVLVLSTTCSAKRLAARQSLEWLRQSCQ